jgi:NAD(P)H dehydrogenase (quinone)
MTLMTIAITGSNGSIGSQLLARLGDAARPITRADAAYRETAKLTAALRGSDTVFLVSARESADRMADHYSAIDAIVASGARKIVYLSFFGAAPDCTFTFGRDHFHTEQRILETGLDYVFVRDNFYQKIVPHFAGADGVIRGPAGKGLLSAVADRDVVDVAAAALTGSSHDGATYGLTGPEAMSMDDYASALTRVSGRAVSFMNETVEEAYASRAVYNAPKFEVDGWVSTYTAIANGEVAGVTNDVLTVTGHEPQSFDEFLIDNPETWRHLLPA